jgi:acyl-CoA synthetase (NDP forming)
VLTFGLGGIHVELFNDVTRRLLPIDRRTSDQLIREIRAFPILAGTRGKPPKDLAALSALLVDLGDFVRDHESVIEEIELNPIWVGPAGHAASILDAVITARL